jgi:hypothetical protein
MAAMLHVDADELYDLSEAARILRADPVRIRRWARTGAAPLVPRPTGDFALPRAWVDATAGRTGSDPEALLGFWRERLAPPSAHARRVLRDATQLTVKPLLTQEETARRLRADAARLGRLSAQGVLPGLRVDGETCFDEVLVTRLAEGDVPGAELRRREVAQAARFEYATDLTVGAVPPATQAPPAPPQAVAAAPRAWHLPDEIADLDGLPRPEPQPEGEAKPPPDGSRLIRAEGFETLDEE